MVIFLVNQVSGDICNDCTVELKMNKVLSFFLCLVSAMLCH